MIYGWAQCVLARSFWCSERGVGLWSQQGFVARTQAADSALGTPAASPTPGNTADEKEIRATADDFVKAFNAADAKAVGALGGRMRSTPTSLAKRSRAALRSKRNMPTCSRSIAADHDGHDRVDPLPGARHRR